MQQHKTNLDDNNGFLYHVVNFRLDQVQECADTPFSRLLNFDGTPSNGANRLPYKIHINFSGISGMAQETTSNNV